MYLLNFIRLQEDQWIFTGLFYVIFKMWDLKYETPLQLWSSGSLPPITYDWLIIILITLIASEKFVRSLLSTYFKIDRIRIDPNSTSLQRSSIYHLAILILVLSEIDWNIFDLGIWSLAYVGVGIIRNALSSIKLQRQSLLGTFNFDSKLIRLLTNSKVLGGILFGVSFSLFLILQIIFMGLNLKIIHMLVFPLMMLAVEALFLFLISATCEKDLLIYFNHNISSILPTYKLELIQKIIASSIRVWHYYNLTRFFLKTLIQRMGVIEYIWIYSVVYAGISAIRTLYISIGKYRNYNKLMARYDRLFRNSGPAPDQNCTICLTELLNCRQLIACGHKFHYRCLLEWMQTKMHCPICRAPINL